MHKASPKVLHLIETSGPGGAENMLINNIVALKTLNIESGVLLLKNGWLKDRLEQLDIPCTVLPLRRFFSLDWLWKATRHIHTNGYTVLHSHEFAMNCHAALLSMVLRKKAIATVHGKNYYPNKLIRRYLYKYSAQLATFVAVSDDIRTFLASSTKMDIKKIQVVANGVDIDKFKYDGETRLRVRNSLGICDDDILIGAVGNLYPVKGHSYLIESLSILKSSGQKIRAVIAGRGGEEQALQKLIDQHGLSDTVKLLGFRSDVGELIKAFDIFVMPSISEGMPLSILEAMAAKLPVVASHVGGIPELISDGKNGLLVAPASPQALADALSSLTRSKEVRDLMGARGLALVTEQFSQARSTAAYLNLYTK